MNYRAALARGISKVMAKMGISTLHSYKVCLVLNHIFAWKCLVIKQSVLDSRSLGVFILYVTIPFDMFLSYLHSCYFSIVSYQKMPQILVLTFREFDPD